MLLLDDIMGELISSSHHRWESAFASMCNWILFPIYIFQIFTLFFSFDRSQLIIKYLFLLIRLWTGEALWYAINLICGGCIGFFTRISLFLLLVSRCLRKLADYLLDMKKTMLEKIISWYVSDPMHGYGCLGLLMLNGRISLVHSGSLLEAFWIIQNGITFERKLQTKKVLLGNGFNSGFPLVPILNISHEKKMKRTNGKCSFSFIRPFNRWKEVAQ